MTGDTTPQDLAREIKDYLAEGWSGPRDRALLEKAAGLLCSSPVVQPQQYEGRFAPKPSAAGEVEPEKLVVAVAEALRDFKFEVGPNTLDQLNAGQAVYLRPDERHRLAHAAVMALGQVTADE